MDNLAMVPPHGNSHSDQSLMTAYIALLRGVNVGGHGTVAMTDLRDCVTRLGFTDVRTLLQSGNLVFASEKRPTVALEQLLEKEVTAQLDLQADFMIRTAAEWGKIIARNPFPAEAKSDPGHLVVVALKEAAKQKDVESLRAAFVGPETIRADGRQLYILYPDGQGRSRLTNTFIEKKLGTRGTARNWNTVLKLGALAQG
jgi:uncharacterized protein (DUF1697 family)